MKTTTTRIRIIGLTAALLAAAGLTACGTESSSAVQADQSAGNAQQKSYQQNQPQPRGNWSQYRQTLIDIENAEITGVSTTTFFYNQGGQTPIKSCPSLGFPVATTSQLTNPMQIDYNGGNGGGNVAIPQQEPTGVFTGDSSGTYVVCVQDDGTKRIDYWEGFVETEGGSAHFDKTSGQIVDDGHTTVNSKSHG